MFARALASLKGPDGRDRRRALAASLVFHAAIVGFFLWLFVPADQEPGATVTIEVAIVGADGTESPANTGSEQMPSAAQVEARLHKPPAPAARSAEPKDVPPPAAAMAAAPPPSPANDAVPLPASPSPPAVSNAASNAARAGGVLQAQPGVSGSDMGSTGPAAATASAGQQGSGEGDRPPRYKLGSGSTPYPPYPMVARRNGYQGRVVVRLDVAADGRATDAQVLVSSGHDILDQSAVDTLRAWKLEPALAGGRPVPGSVNVPVRFRLSG